MMKDPSSNLIEVTAALIQQDGQILLVRRAPSKHIAGFWEFPGGKVEENEEEKDCLKREILEELGIEVLMKI